MINKKKGKGTKNEKENCLPAYGGRDGVRYDGMWRKRRRK